MHYKDKFPAEDALEDASGKPREEPDEYDKWQMEQDVLNSMGDEFDHFISNTPLALPKGTTALDWWLNPEHYMPYPCLYHMAIDILSIPPMSAEPERIFSGARRTISWQRMCLGADNIEKGECLKSWIRSGLIAGWRKEELEALVAKMQEQLQKEWQQGGQQERQQEQQEGLGGSFEGEID
jgi:hypothetical protein